MTIKKRNVAIDIMKGIGIIAVIIGHVDDVPFMPVRQLCFSFHMPLFFLIAGYFHKSVADIKFFIVKSAKRLLIPYLAAAFLLLLYFAFKAFHTGDLMDIPKQIAATFYASGSKHHSMFLGGARPIGAIWFLVALFWCRIAFNIIHLKFKKSYYLVAAGIAIAATALDYYIINLPFAILPGLSALIFYGGGYLFRNQHISNYIKYLCILMWPFSFIFCRIFMASCRFDLYPLAIVGAMGGTLLVYVLSKSIETNFDKLSKVFCWLGEMSLVILCWHMLECNTKLYQHLHLPSDLYIQLPIRIGIPILLAYLCTKISFARKIFQIPQSKNKEPISDAIKIPSA